MDLSRFASPRPPGLQIGAASLRGACSLRRPRHRGVHGGGGGNLMVASALRGSSGGLFYAAQNHGRLRLRRTGSARCQGNDSLAYVDGPLEGTKGSSEGGDEPGTTSGSDAEERARSAAVDVDDLRDLLNKARKDFV